MIVCIKPSGVLSTDEPGGLPELIRRALQEPEANIRTVHRLDRVVSGVMVLARTARAASDLSAQIRCGRFQKTYLAICHGAPPKQARWEDLLIRNPTRRKTELALEPGPGVVPAALEMETIASGRELSLVRIRLLTGRTHQIRAQFSGRGFPLAGDRKYGIPDEWVPIALWSYRIRFLHPRSLEPMEWKALPPLEGPWAEFRDTLESLPESAE